MIEFIGGALGFGFGVGFLCEGWRSIVNYFLQMVKRVG